MPAFSIVIPCFNAEATLADTLASLAAQNVTDWEAICVDDGSTDRTPEIIADHAARDPRIRLARHGGKGPSAARNAGVEGHARAPLIAFCDADDLWHPGKLARLADAFTDTGTDAVFGRVSFFNAQATGAPRLSTVPEGPLKVEMLLAENPVCTMSNLTVRRTAWDRTGGFDETLVHNEDLDWLIRLVGGGAKVVGDHALHIGYRTDAGGLSSELARMKAGRDVALAAAACFGVFPGRADEAVFRRYLARRALRLDDGAKAALGHTLAGLARSPRGFLFPLRRGGATALAAFLAPLLPLALRRALFSA